jgi:serine protease AprX
MIRAFLCVCILFSLSGSHAPGNRAEVRDLHGLAAAKLSPALRADLADGAETTFLVLLAEQADLGHVSALPTKQARGRAVYDALRQVAQASQAPLRARLEAQGVAYRSFYVVNMLAVRGDASLALALAARPDVARLEANPAVRLDFPVVERDQAQSLTQPSTVEWGVQAVRADEVWDLGYTGQGIVVAGQDTGYDWDHPALQAQYRGWDGATATHDYNWHDAIHSGGGVCGADAPAPCDDHSHGTHTMGIMVGHDGDNQIGVAPGARWIGCRNMDQGVGTPATYIECFEFFLAPYPIGGDPMSDGNPDLAPHVVNNSWTCPAREGCNVDSLRAVVENVRAAGIVVVAAAGNTGSSCASINAPPALYDASFTIGATYSNGYIATFSGRGPVTVDGSNRLKPDVSAPGVGVRSSMPGGGYGYKDGTSMATPHVAGLVALLWSAAPHLMGEVERTQDIIRETAQPVVDGSCGGDADGHPNNVYGWGFADALAAMQGPSLAVAAQAKPTAISAGDRLTFTFSVANWSPLTSLTDVSLTDTLPVSTTFASATGTYSRTGDSIRWALGAIAPGVEVSVSLAVTVGHAVPRGTHIVNADYGVRSSQVPTPVVGAPAVAWVPWRLYVPLVLKDEL